MDRSLSNMYAGATMFTPTPAAVPTPAPATPPAGHQALSGTGIQRPTFREFTPATKEPVPFETRTAALPPAPPATVEPTPEALRLLQLQEQAFTYASQITASVPARQKHVQAAQGKIQCLSDRIKTNLPQPLHELLEQIYGDILNNQFQWASQRFTHLAEKYWEILGPDASQTLKRLVYALQP
jgi:hypothetical protein